ncbi:MAG: DMT family transporter [Beijerinckiaceae bacterium]
MPYLLSSPAFLLIAVGSILGLNFPLGKMALQAGVPGLLWAAVISLGGAAVLGFMHLLKRQASPLTPQYLRYFSVTAIVSYAIPNALVMLIIPQIGSGLTAIYFTLSPLVTVLLSRITGLRAPKNLEYFGIAFGFCGALLVASARGEVGKPAEWYWIALGFVIPLSLATGNVYRSLDWPEGAAPTWLAIGSNGVAAVLLLALCFFTGDLAKAGILATIPWVVAGQVFASALMFLLFFRLQVAGGPVTLSQIGTVAAGVGILIGAGLLGERYPGIVWLGVLIIGVGLSLTILARRKA